MAVIIAGARTRLLGGSRPVDDGQQRSGPGQISSRQCDVYANLVSRGRAPGISFDASLCKLPTCVMNFLAELTDIFGCGVVSGAEDTYRNSWSTLARNPS